MRIGSVAHLRRLLVEDILPNGPSGFVLWEWDADAEFGEAAGEKWLHLRPDKWNPSRPVVYGWRYDPREFAPGAAPARDARRRNATRVMDD